MFGAVNISKTQAINYNNKVYKIYSGITKPQMNEK
nr:MAG TPA: hypothetical protein [Bacteriophage sp.]